MYTTIDLPFGKVKLASKTPTNKRRGSVEPVNNGEKQFTALFSLSKITVRGTEVAIDTAEKLEKALEELVTARIQSIGIIMDTSTGAYHRRFSYFIACRLTYNVATGTLRLTSFNPQTRSQNVDKRTMFEIRLLTEEFSGCSNLFEFMENFITLKHLQETYKKCKADKKRIAVLKEIYLDSRVQWLSKLGVNLTVEGNLKLKDVDEAIYALVDAINFYIQDDYLRQFALKRFFYGLVVSFTKTNPRTYLGVYSSYNSSIVAVINPSKSTEMEEYFNIELGIEEEEEEVKYHNLVRLHVHEIAHHIDLTMTVTGSPTGCNYTSTRLTASLGVQAKEALLMYRRGIDFTISTSMETKRAYYKSTLEVFARALEVYYITSKTEGIYPKTIDESKRINKLARYPQAHLAIPLVKEIISKGMHGYEKGGVS